jgi:hypothetical protein
MGTDNTNNIKGLYKTNLRAILKISGGIKNLLCTKYNFIAVLVSIILLCILFITIDISQFPSDLNEKLIQGGISILTSIVGLGLAGLTLIITFSNPDLIERDIERQVSKFDESNFDFTFFQKALAKFVFIVLFQTMTLFVLFCFSVILQMKIQMPIKITALLNLLGFFISCYLILYSILLVWASVLNLFYFSQTSNFSIMIKKFVEGKKTN